MAKAAAAAPEKPIFVVNHQPLNFTHAVGDNEHNNGISTEGASEKLQAIMDKYEHVFYISGHQHYGLNDGAQGFPADFKTVEQVGEHITSINLPSYEYGSFITGGNAFISRQNLLKGDIVCFDCDPADGDLVDHIGIYIGQGYFIHGSKTAGRILVSTLNSGYYKSAFCWGRRVIK